MLSRFLGIAALVTLLTVPASFASAQAFNPGEIAPTAFICQDLDSLMESALNQHKSGSDKVAKQHLAKGHCIHIPDRYPVKLLEVVEKVPVDGGTFYFWFVEVNPMLKAYAAEFVREQNG